MSRLCNTGIKVSYVFRSSCSASSSHHHPLAGPPAPPFFFCSAVGLPLCPQSLILDICSPLINPQIRANDTFVTRLKSAHPSPTTTNNFFPQILNQHPHLCYLFQVKSPFECHFLNPSSYEFEQRCCVYILYTKCSVRGSS